MKRIILLLTSVFLASPGYAQEHSMHMNHDQSKTNYGEKIPKAPPPESAGTGPADSAESIWGAQSMRKARNELAHKSGGTKYTWFQADRLEHRFKDGADAYVWDVQGYYGGDYHKIWFKSEGEGQDYNSPESADIEILYSRAIAPYYDFQTGIRYDWAGKDLAHAVVGIQGLAPYMFEFDTAAYLSEDGDLTASTEVELDQKITQRLILQPRVEAGFSAQKVENRGIGDGLTSFATGVRMRYEIRREFAPYVGIEYERKVGETADIARREGEDVGNTFFIAGVRFWF